MQIFSYAHVFQIKPRIKRVFCLPFNIQKRAKQIVAYVLLDVHYIQIVPQLQISGEGPSGTGTVVTGKGGLDAYRRQGL